MSDYRVRGIHEANELDLRDGIFLVIMHANRVPPHLSLVVNGKQFSLDVKGPSLDQDVAVLLRNIYWSKAATLFIKLSVPTIFSLLDLQDEVAKVTAAYPSVQAGMITCLAPIKDFCESVYQTSVGDIDFVFDLLPKLEEQGVLQESYHLHMHKYIDIEGGFELLTYSMFDINEQIQSVNSVLA